MFPLLIYSYSNNVAIAIIYTMPYATTSNIHNDKYSYIATHSKIAKLELKFKNLYKLAWERTVTTEANW